MRYSKYIGVVAAAALIAACFLPWVVVPGLNITLNGLNGKVNDQVSFGTQIISHSFFCLLMIVFFVLPGIGVKRANVVIGAIHVAWAVKNYYVFTACRVGECPEKKIGVYLIVLLSIIMLVMTLLAQVKFKNEE